MTSAGTTRWLALLGMVLALALPAVLTACGGDSPDTGGERAATPRTGAATATAAPRPTATRASPAASAGDDLAIGDTKF